MKKTLKTIAAATLMAASLAAVAACSRNVTVTFELPTGVSGTAPAPIKAAQYSSITLPMESGATAIPERTHFAGWLADDGIVYTPGSEFEVGTFDIELVASFKANTVYTAYCEYAGNMFMAGKGDLGPLPAATTFYADYTWEAHAEGKAMYSDFFGTWSYSSADGLKITLTEQDGVAKNDVVEVTKDDRCYSWTLSHPTDRSGTSLKYHKNHASVYDFLKAYNAAFGASEALPASEPTFALNFDGTIWQSGWMGDTAVGMADGAVASISGKRGQEVTLPENGFTREGYEFVEWQVMDATKSTHKAGEKYTLVDWDLSVRPVWKAVA